VIEASKWTSAHPALERAICLFQRQSPALAERAIGALEIILEGIYTSSWSEVAWEFSRLTGGGFPLEFTFSSSDQAIRYAAEVAGPEVAETERLHRATRLISRLGMNPPSETLICSLSRIQSAGPLRYGAWIGGRHSGFGDRYKLYAEVPPAAHCANDLVQQLFGAEPLLSQRTPKLVMIGCDVETSRIEFYFQVTGLEPWEVGGLLRRTNLASRQTELLNLIEETYGRSLERGLPGSRLGFSFSVAPGKMSTAFSIVCYAGVVGGGDKSIRRRLLALAETKGWDFSSYELISAPLAGRNIWATYHTMMTFSVAAEGPPVLQIGLRPPEPQVQT